MNRLGTFSWERFHRPNKELSRRPRHVCARKRAAQRRGYRKKACLPQGRIGAEGWFVCPCLSLLVLVLAAFRGRGQSRHAVARYRRLRHFSRSGAEAQGWFACPPALVHVLVLVLAAFRGRGQSRHAVARYRRGRHFSRRGARPLPCLGYWTLVLDIGHSLKFSPISYLLFPIPSPLCN